ncbi:NAD(P)-binding protein [Mycena amicta]|nr:NAD(P)-binding protein [Mycena amicta]
MSSKPVVLVLGATGFTGRLVARHLATHRDDGFTLALGARSKARLDLLAKDLGLDGTVRLQVVDVTRPEQIETAVANVTVVLNTVGPFWIWGTPVVQACVRHGIHYVDLTGENHWIRQIIKTCHFAAMKSGAMIVPSCGIDSVPADLLPYLAAKKLREFTGKNVDIDTSVSAYSLRGTMSGGTLSTLITVVEQVPPIELQAGNVPFALSPVVGAEQPPSRFVYSLRMPDTKKMLSGAFFFMSTANRPLQQRSWGLFETEAATDKTQLHYGPHFKYDEFLVTGSRLLGFFVSLAQAIVFSAFLFPPTRWLLKKLLPKPGEGPTEESMKSGRTKVTNITTAVASSSSPPLQVKTVLQGKGDPGYWVSSVMVAEAALSLALHHNDLPAMARRGGVLTPATAFGDVFAGRLNAAGISIESHVITPDGKKIN